MFIINHKTNQSLIKGPLAVLSNVSKNFGTQEIFSGVNLIIGKKDRLAIAGPNGIGKSTLLGIIMGTEKADEGEVFGNKNLCIGYLPQETSWDSMERKIITEIKSANLKIFNLIEAKKKYEILISDTKRFDLKNKLAEYGKIIEQYEKLDGYKYEILAEETLKKFNFPEEDWTRKVKSLSGGEKTRLAIAKIVINKPNMLILDEPTNHLDLPTIEWLENFLILWDKAVVVVSHDKNFLDLVCNQTFELHGKKSKLYHSNYSGYLAEKEKNKIKEEESYERQQRYLSKQREFIDRFRCKATKARAVQSRIKMIDKIDKIQKPEKRGKAIKIRFNALERLPEKVLEFENLLVGIDDIPLAIFEGLWEVRKKDKIGIIGPNGAGKSTFLKTLIGKIRLIDGKISFAEKIKIGYYAQAYEELDPKKSILDEVHQKTRVSEEKIRNILGSLLFSGKDVFKKISDLSGGERARVAIAELILQESNMLLLDEPTNHLDLESKDCMLEVLKNFDGPIIIVSHDREVLNKVCNIIWEIKNNEAKKYLGNYEDHQKKLHSEN